MCSPLVAVIAGLPYRCALNMGEAFGAMRHCPPHPARRAWGDFVRNASPAPRRKPIVSIWHGDADTTVGHFASATEQTKQWCDVHGLREQDGLDDCRRWREASGMAGCRPHDPGWNSTWCPAMGHGVPIDYDGCG